MPARTFILAILALCVSTNASRAQDSQSLGDVARQTRQQKQSPANPGKNPADGQNSAAKSHHVITNEEIPEHEDMPQAAPQPSEASIEPTPSAGKRPAEFWKSQILRVKNSITTQQRNIEALDNSIHFAGGNYEKHVAWNERQRHKQQQLEIMKSQLTELQKRLDEMQDAARRQGYGSSVYDP